MDFTHLWLLEGRGGEDEGKETEEEEWRISLSSTGGEGLAQVTGIGMAHTSPAWRFTGAG